VVKYPIKVQRSNYRGNDPRKRQKAQQENQIASELEGVINDMLLKQTDPIQVYTYDEIAHKTGYPVERVTDLCFSIDYGHNGFTVIRHGMTYEEAMNTSKNH
jgi:hypothetical protein